MFDVRDAWARLVTRESRRLTVKRAREKIARLVCRRFYDAARDILHDGQDPTTAILDSPKGERA